MQLRAEILTVGHSTLSYERFLALVRSAGVTAIADVRSTPYSRRYPHFNRVSLKTELRHDGISYVFLGDELGGRPRNPELFCDGVADYEKMSLLPGYREGINRVVSGSERHRIALMCSEGNPAECHRCLLVGRSLREQGSRVIHIMQNAKFKSQLEIEEDLLTQASLKDDDMFLSSQNKLSISYRLQAMSFAFSLEKRRGAVAAE